jgi:hypothetical protein
MPEQDLVKVAGIATLADFDGSIKQIKNSINQKSSKVRNQKKQVKLTILQMFFNFDTDTSMESLLRDL